MVSVFDSYRAKKTIVILEDSRALPDERGKFFYVQEWGPEFPERWKSFVSEGQEPLGRYSVIDNRALNLIHGLIKQLNAGERTIEGVKEILTLPLEKLSLSDLH